MRQIKFNYFTKEAKLQGRELSQAFQRVLYSGQYILGREVASFEDLFAGYLSIQYCIGVGNGLEALQIALLALGVGEGDEVITTPLSAVATTLAVLAVGARPVFMDTTDFGLIDAGLVQKAITPKTRAILPVHLYGQSVDLDKILHICKKHKLFLIEDACQAHGSEYNGKKLGTFGDLGCFSFYPTKNLGALGDGGAIVTGNGRLAKICREIRDYGQADKYHHVRFGLNSRLDEFQAALLKVRLKHLDRDNRKRLKLSQRYIGKLSGIDGIEIVKEKDVNGCNFHLFVIKTRKRDDLQRHLQLNGITTIVHYPTIIPDQPFLKKEYGTDNFIIARDFVKRILSLPCHPLMSDKDVDYVCSQIKFFF